MTMKLYTVGFGDAGLGGERHVLKTVKEFSSYEAARKAVIEYRKKPEPEYTAIQIGCDDISEMMVYFKNDWIIRDRCWTKEEFEQHSGKHCTLRIPVKNSKEQRMRMKWGWANAVVEVFQKKFGVKFLDLKERWQDHYKQGVNTKANDYLVYSCVVPESSMRALKQSYGCTIA